MSVCELTAKCVEMLEGSFGPEGLEENCASLNPLFLYKIPSLWSSSPTALITWEAFKGLHAQVPPQTNQLAIARSRVQALLFKKLSR